MVLKTVVLACAWFLLTGPAVAQKSGAHYWSDADGNGMVEVPDMSALLTILGNPGSDDASYYQGHPQSRFRQELDGNGLLEVPDLSILISWLSGNFSNRPGNPDQLLLDGDTHLDLDFGDSVTLSAYALSPPAAGAKVRTGFGVIFKIGPSSTCAGAQVYGYDVAGGATVNDWRSGAAYHYTLQPGSPADGRATVRVNTNGCGYGQVIKVEAYVPDDGEANVAPGRFPSKLAAVSNFVITVVNPNPAPETTITSYPANPDNNPDPSFEFTCDQAPCTYKCKLDSGSTVDCTSPMDYTGLTDGAYTFRVQAINGSLIPDPTPEVWTWTIDTVPPVITIVQPPGGITADPNISIYITYSDAGSGIDLASLVVYHNDTDITSQLTINDTYATGSRTGTAGGNVFNAFISDLAGNQSLDSALVMIEDGQPPVITFISPPPGGTVNTGTPTFNVTGEDFGSGVDWLTAIITIDGIDRTSHFTFTGNSAIWNPGNQYVLANGPHQWVAQVRDNQGNLRTANSDFIVDITCAAFNVDTANNPTPNFTVWGNQIIITGAGFAGPANVYFTGPLGQLTAEIIPPITPTQITAFVPGGAGFNGDGNTVEVWVESPAGSNCNSDRLSFTIGLPYAYIANRLSHSVTIMDYRYNSVTGSLIVPGASPTPWAVDITPDGRYAFVANYSANNVTVIRTQDNAVINTVPLQCSGVTPINPRGIAISPDGSKAFVVTNNRYLSVIEIKKALDGNTCNAVQNRAYTDGTAFSDISITPNGERAVIPATGNPGVVLNVNIQRYFTVDSNVNPYYLNHTAYNLSQGDVTAVKTPLGVAMLPQRVQATAPANPWWSAIINNGLSSDTVEHGVILRLPGIAHQDRIDTVTSTVPINTCTRGYDAAVSNLGEKAFIGFQTSNNIGITGLLESNTNDLLSATRRCSSSNTYGCPCPAGNCDCMVHKVAYTPYREKVLATVFWTSQANSKVMVLDATTIPLWYQGTISTAHYSCVSHVSIHGPEGIAIQPHYDRDRDGISDLVEARNHPGILRADDTVLFVNPVVRNVINSYPTDAALVGGVHLPNEGIGYRHFYGTDPPLVDNDNWGTLKFINIIEQVGREWNRRYPQGPRISIGDISLRQGGYWSDHSSHRTGMDADIRYVRSDGLEINYSFSTPAPPGYSHDLTNDLIDLFCKAGIKRVFVDNRSLLQNDTYIPGCAVQVDDPDHYNHFHISAYN